MMSSPCPPRRSENMIGSWVGQEIFAALSCFRRALRSKRLSASGRLMFLRSFGAGCRNAEAPEYLPP